MMAFQTRVHKWMLACFGQEIAADKVERNFRFFEEAGELVQALGMTEEEARRLVSYVWGRPVGEPNQEVGGVMVTLAALSNASGLQIELSAWRELERIERPAVMDKIRLKQATKHERGVGVIP